MASPPNYGSISPPAPSALALPRQRPTLSLPTGGGIRRKTSIASATSSSHPLRQTSFPPTDRYGSPGGGGSHAIYSPTDSADISDSEITSAISGPAGEIDTTRKRKRGEKRNRGRPPKNPPRQSSQSLINGADEGKSRRNARDGSALAAEGDVEEDDDDEDEDGFAAGDRTGAYEQDRFISNDRARIDLHQQMPVAQQERHDSWHRAKLKTADVRRLVNQTLSQSVPANVITVVQAYTKMFAGMLIEEAREVQSEWMATEAERADGSVNPAYKKLGHGDELENKDEPLSNGVNAADDEDRTDDSSSMDERRTAVGGLRKAIEECDRGPLLADHLRESLRRYKKARFGGTVGFTGMSLEGRDSAAARMSGRRLFR